tara:strand:+ start:2455 stop:3216 length:762 start_codon:yes stop_codon:yes gene_type:complete
VIRLRDILKESTAVSVTDIIAATLIGEAGGEKDPGMQAIANVLRNRKNSSSFPNTYKAVILKDGSAFEMWIGKSAKTLVPKKKKHPKWNQAYKLATNIDSLKDVTSGATHYYAHSGAQQIDAPYWANNDKLKTRAIKQMKPGAGVTAYSWEPIKTIGNHKFGKLIRRKLKSGDFTIYPNPVTKNSKVTIKVNPDHLPQRLIKIKIPKINFSDEWFDVKQGILNFTSPNDSGSYDIIVYDNNNNTIDTIKLIVQ